MTAITHLGIVVRLINDYKYEIGATPYGLRSTACLEASQNGQRSVGYTCV